LITATKSKETRNNILTSLIDHFVCSSSFVVNSVSQEIGVSDH